MKKKPWPVAAQCRKAGFAHCGANYGYKKRNLPPFYRAIAVLPFATDSARRVHPVGVRGTLASLRTRAFFAPLQPFSPMAIDTAVQNRSSFDLKSALLPVVAVMLKSTDVGVLAAELAQRLAADPDFFDNDPVLIDLTGVREDPAPIDFAALTRLLHQHHTVPVAVRGGSAVQMAAARSVGLVAAPDAPPTRPPTPPEVREIIHEVVHEVEVIRPAPRVPTVVVDKPLRSGQQVYARGADLVVLAMVSFGAEVIADGNIHVYAPLRGRAIAGARGDTGARIFTTCMDPQLISIAGIYRTTEVAIAADVVGKPAQVRLDGEKLLIEPL